jgi:hypothetical protein
MVLTAYRHAIVLFFLAVTAGGLAYTVFRIDVPVLHTFARFSYQTMSPYQGYQSVHRDFAIEGQTSAGDWERIPVSRYMPGRRGERFVRSGFQSFANRGDAAKRDAYNRFALRVRYAEASDGRMYDVVHVFVEEWPLSPNGIDALRMPPHLNRTLAGTSL